MFPITVILHDARIIKYHKIADEVSRHVTDKIPIMNVNMFFIISRPFCIFLKKSVALATIWFVSTERTHLANRWN